jgi:hypothetical protein
MGGVGVFLSGWERGWMGGLEEWVDGLFTRGVYRIGWMNSRVTLPLYYEASRSSTYLRYNNETVE